jgi:hypothetical protein
MNSLPTEEVYMGFEVLTPVVMKNSIFWGYNVMQSAFRLVSFAVYWTVKIEAICSSETSVGSQWTTWRYMQKTVLAAVRVGTNLGAYIAMIRY